LTSSIRRGLVALATSWYSKRATLKKRQEDEVRWETTPPEKYPRRKEGEERALAKTRISSIKGIPRGEGHCVVGENLGNSKTTAD